MIATTSDIAWPEGKRFAFSIFDDTDMATLENVGGVYAFLGDAGFRTTKSCWVFRGDPRQGKFPGDTLDDAPYRRWLLDLQAKGFEIGWHGATWHYFAAGKRQPRRWSDSPRSSATIRRSAPITQPIKSRSTGATAGCMAADGGSTIC